MNSWARTLADSLLATMQVRVVLPKTQQITEPVRAFCDTGSQLNLITTDCIQRIGANYTSMNVHVLGVGDSPSLEGIGYIDTEIIARNSTSPNVPTRLVVVAKITNAMPANDQPKCFVGILKEHELADPNYFVTGRVDILLGIGFWNQVVSTGILREENDKSMAVATQTTYGWVITTSHDRVAQAGGRSLCLTVSNTSEHLILQQLNESIKKFWEVENLAEKPLKSKSEQLAESIFMQTHKRELSGRYTVRIPFKTGGPILGNSRRTALKQFLKVEERYSKNPDVERLYRSFFDDYIKAGHMILAPPLRTSEQYSYYTPYHLIIGKKPRTVFNSSCKTDTGVSLNDLQLAGARLQDDLPIILIRFRMHWKAVAADIVQMFRQVGIDPQDWDYQRILWRPDKHGPILEYIITVIMWGMTSASFNAVRTLQQLALDGAIDYPLASASTLKDFYMDDYLSGADSDEDLRKLCRQMIALHESGGFKLAKWVSNSAMLKNSLPVDNDQQVSIISDAGILGMMWNVARDELALKLKWPTHEGAAQVITKADVVSAISKVYDPTGLFAPVILTGKLIMQDFWREPSVKWKDPAPAHLLERWKSYQKELPLLSRIAIPRWLGCRMASRIECHLFADASIKAYGAVAYFRVLDSDGHITTNLVTSKSRVAPIKAQTIPRLELFAAWLAVQLIAYLQPAIQRSDITYHCWTDSMIVMHWLRKDSSKLSPFVAARTARILEKTEASAWKYVNTAENPADVLSRSIPANELGSHKLWWKGPTWLNKPNTEWPAQPLLNLSPEEEIHDTKETRKITIAAKSMLIVPAVVAPGSLPPGDPQIGSLSVCSGSMVFESLFKRRSTLNGLLRVTAYVIRFIDKLKQVKQKVIVRPATIVVPTPALPHATVEEKEKAFLYLIRIVQRQSFYKEIQALSRGETIPPTSSIRRLTPQWKVEDQTLRIKGRLANAERSYDERHQLLLPYHHDLVQLIIQDAHMRTSHGGPQICIALLRQKVWILKVRIAVRSFIASRCVVCIRHSKTNAQQLMGTLPLVRTTPAPPFSRVGVDFAGPFNLRKTAATVTALRSAVTTIPKPPTTIKGWVVIYVCLVTRAVHIDVTRGLHVEAFLETFARMTARRGPCVEIWSDNGTTFVGADNELTRVMEAWQNQFPTLQLADMGTAWRMITPGAPFRGGIWEAAVKSFKHHLKRVLGSRMLTVDQMYTLVVQIEACMNARPLFPQSDDPADLNPITPAHLVIGRSTLQRPLAEELQEMPDNRLTLWGLQQKLFQQFWASWKDDYISSLQIRNKWYQTCRNLKPGDMVLIQDENTPPSKWPLGRITAVIKSKDELVRSATIQIPVVKKDRHGKMYMSTTEYDRPVQKLCILLADNITPPPMPSEGLAGTPV